MNSRCFVRLASLPKWRHSVTNVDKLLPSGSRSFSLPSRLTVENCVRLYVGNQGNIFTSQRKYVHKLPFTRKTVNDRVLLVLNLYDKIDNAKLKPDSHFINDLGLDSLDHIEIITMVEEEFSIEIPDGDAEELMTPQSIIQYIYDKEDVYH